MSSTFQDVLDRDNRRILSGALSEPIRIEYLGGSGPVSEEITCIFDQTFQIIDPETGAPIASSFSRANIFLKDLEATTGERLENFIKERNVLITLLDRDDKKYYVTMVQEDGTGCAQLILNEQS